MKEMNQGKMLRMMVVPLMLTMLLTLPLDGVGAQSIRYPHSISLGKVDASIMGNGTVSNLGFPVSSRGDVNGDGYDDLLVGSKNGAFLFLGGPTGWKMRLGVSSADVWFNPGSIYYGNDLAIVGDLNGDGYADMAFADNYGVSIIFGRPGSWQGRMNTNEIADARFSMNHSVFIPYMTGVGDVNGDGFDDMVIVPTQDAYHENATIYLLLGKKDGWNKENNLNSIDVTFTTNENEYLTSHFYQRTIAGGGDINGDGFDDIIIRYGSNVSDDFSQDRIAIIFGKTAGWKINTPLDSADAFIVENSRTKNEFPNNIDGWLDIRGDYNGDNMDDILIGTGWIGAITDLATGPGAYLIFGKADWPKFTDISTSDASFTIQGKDSGGYITVSSAGDVNGDGFDDILIGQGMLEKYMKNGGAAYLILGKEVGWSAGMPLESAAASMFLGETQNDEVGEFIDCGGDINGDGYDDIMISSAMNPPPTEGCWRGQVYIIFPAKNTLPDWSNSIRVCSDENCEIQTHTALMGDKLSIELKGGDEDYEHANIAEVRLIREKGSPATSILRLKETGNDTGIYRGQFTLGNVTNPHHELIGAMVNEKLTVQAIRQPSLNTSIIVKGFKLETDNPMNIIAPNEMYNAKFWARGNVSLKWEFATNATWLTWNATEHVLSGIPTLSGNRLYYVHVIIYDELGQSDEINQTLIIDYRLNGIRILSPKNGSIFNIADARNLTLTSAGPENATNETLSFKWYDNGLQIADGCNATATFDPGDHLLTFRVSDDWTSTADSVRFSVEGSNQIPTQDSVGSTKIVAVTVIIPLIVGLMIIGLATEIGRYGSVIALAPLYSKTQKETLLDNFTRGQIYRFIVEHPGVHYGRILDELKLNNGTAAFHLRKLEMDQFVVSRTDGFRKRFYPSHQAIPEIPSNYEQIIAAIRLHPGITQKELIKELDISPSTVNMHVQKMEAAGIIETRKEGKMLLCYIDEQ